MKEQITAGSRIQLDPIGNFYSSISNPKNPGTFGVSVHLKEPINTEILQQTVHDIAHRLPFLNVCIKRGVIWNYHEVLDTPPTIMPAKDFSTPCSMFEKGKGHVIRILYGERHFTVEVLHSICDGTALTKIVSGMLVRYYELLGISTDKTGFIDCNKTIQPEEMANDFDRFSNMNKVNSLIEKKSFRLPVSEKVIPYSVSYRLDLSKIKLEAKKYSATVTEYMLAKMFIELSKERAKNNSKKPITICVPVNCRNYFPSKTLRNFVSLINITMPETNDFSKMINYIRAQFKKVNTDYIMDNINMAQKLIKLGSLFPMILKRFSILLIDHFGANGYTTALSNVGLVRLPKEIEERVDMMEFTLCPEQHFPYVFGCITVGNTLTLTATVTEKNVDAVNRIIDAINKTN